MGASKSDILGQFFCEALLSTLFAIMAGFAIAKMALPWFGQLIEMDLTAVDYGTWFFYLCLGGLIIGTTLLAGFYPGLVLSRVKPITALSASKPAASRNFLRKVLTITQFALSILLMTVCFTLYQQLSHLKNLDLGVNLKNIAIVGVGGGMAMGMVKPGQNTLNEQLLAHPAIESLSAAPFNFNASGDEYRLVGSTAAPIALSTLIADEFFLDHYQIKIAAGVGFDPNIADHKTATRFGKPPAGSGAVILSQMGMDKLGISNPEAAIGKKLALEGDGNVVLTVIGATRAFPKIMRQSGNPLGGDLILLSDNKGTTPMITARISEGQLQASKAHITQVGKNIYGHAIQPQFIDQELGKLFEVLSRAMASVAIFAILAIVVAILGLYAMSTFTVQRRTREIGIRKVMGCSSTRLTGRLAWDFCKPVFIALAIATPMAYFIANQVIQYFAARIALEWITFGLVPLTTIAIALITVSGHTIKAAQSNPVKALRYE